MGFILDGLDTESYDRSYSDKVLLRRITQFFKPYKMQLGIAALALLSLSTVGALSPILISKLIDLVSEVPKWGYILAASVGVSALGAFNWGFNYLHERLITIVVGKVVYDVRNQVFERTLSQDLSFFDTQATGKLVSRIVSDTKDFSNVVILTAEFMSQFVIIVLLTAFLYTIHPPLTFILLGMAPLASSIALLFRKVARKVTLEAKQANAQINAQIQESVSGIMIAKSFRREQTLYNTFLKNNRLSYRVGLRRGVVLNTIFPVMGITSGSANALVAYLAALAVFGGKLSPGEWYLFMQAVGFFWWPLLNLSSFWSQVQDGLSAAERVFALIDHPNRVVQKGAIPLKITRGSIEFRNVAFSYNSSEQVLKGFSLRIDPGEVVALVGPTGAGKSSLVKLIGRFYEFQEGEILIDDQDIRTLDLAYYRRQIGYITQDPFLFGGTVRDNIRYGIPDASDEEVLRAAFRLNRGEWLEDLAEGLDTEVGEKGSRISYGQRQLVVLARILLKNPKIFLLDEATASIDPFTEVRIQEGLAEVMAGRTSIVIAHRLSTIQNANRIIVLSHGKIVEQGSHAELLSRGGEYASLYNAYFRHQSAEYLEEKRLELEKDSIIY
ncbi:MAG: ABC transporter ATP-binding protein [Spirochaetales bacterium]